MSRYLLVPLGVIVGIWAFRLLKDLMTSLPARKAARANYFSAALTLLRDARRQTQPSGFPRIAGRYRGLMVDLQAVPDTLTFRKLPALWAMVTITEPQPVTGEMHIMSRATGNEPFSTYGKMPFAGNLPHGFPPHCTLRCTDPAALPPPELMARFAALFDDPRVKEVVLSPKGLRIVLLAEEGDRTAYLLYRDAELGRNPLPVSTLEPVLEILSDLHYAQDPLQQAASA